MKKSLFALAALGAFATAAQAQSSVTLYGNIDASVNYIGNAGVANSTSKAGSDAGTGSSSDPTKTGPNTGNAIALYDGAISTSMWGLKGSEDLGGGMKANFLTQGDLPSNNGGTNAEGIFRRGAWVGLQGGFGEIRLGLHSNPIVDASGSLLPVMGNTVNQVRNVIGYAGKDFNRNSVTYVTPVFSGFGAVLQYSLNNTTDAGISDGSAMNARAFYNAGNLDLAAAYQKRTSMTATGNDAQCFAVAQTSAGTSSGTNTYAVSGTSAYPAVTCPSANYGGDVTGYLAGIKYRITPAIQLGVAWAHGDGDNTNYVAGVNSVNANLVSTTASKSTSATIYSANAWMVGLGYQASPSLLLGANWIGTNADSSLYNLQARYSLSKRTTAYVQASMAKNGAGSQSVGGVTNSAFGNFQPISGNTVTNPSSQIQGLAALPNTTQSAIGVGVIHSF